MRVSAGSGQTSNFIIVVFMHIQASFFGKCPDRTLSSPFSALSLS